MKNRYLLLLKMQLYNLFGINRIFHSDNKKEKQCIMVLGVSALLTIGLIIVYSTIISMSLATINVLNASERIFLRFDREETAEIKTPSPKEIIIGIIGLD